MNAIVGCEESQAVTIELRKRGIRAFSCDTEPCSGGHPEWHIVADIMTVINGGVFKTQSGDVVYIERWDLGIFFPPCTFLTVSSNRWYEDQPQPKSGVLVGEARREARREARKFFMRLWDCDIPKVAIENPIGCMSSEFRKPDQVIQPWMFGHGETKATCLWLRGLPKLTPTEIVPGREQRIFKLPPGPDRQKMRSKTFPGIAKAMAEQWSVTVAQPLTLFTP